ncbi:TonB-dependent receptor domain-containing protein [Mariniphaga sp.]|uniref:TonB-dependent receptor domain-containing protein n=1 Tax=Mariniphaga sp. TaxID=1954475 RepID=UPI00356A9449
MKQIMMQKILILNTLLIFLTVIPAAGNSPEDDSKAARITGIVLDEASGTFMEFANIAVYSQADSSLVSGGITNEKGYFEIAGIDYGEYYLEANFIGFGKAKVEDIAITREEPVLDVGRIELRPSSVELEGVEVVADKAQVEFKLDKKVVNVSQVISAVGGTAVDVLENTPSVQVDIEGNVSVRGSSNFTVLIDGRPSVLSGSDALRQIPASALENIEIITNPSAKYEPDGMAGIINLVTKKNSMNGLSGIVNASVGTGDKYRGDFTLNYRTEKFNFLLGADWRDETNYGNMSSSRETFSNDTTTFLLMDGSRNFNRGGNNLKAGIEWFASDKTTFGLSGETGKSKNRGFGNGETRRYTEPESENIFSVTEENSERTSNFYSFNFNFQHNFNNEGHKIEGMAFYSGEESDDLEEESEILANSQYQKTDQFIERVSALETEEETEFRLKVDYTNPFSETGRLEAGLLSRIDAEVEGLDFKVFDEETGNWIVNEDYSNVTDFRRDIHAVYTTYSNAFGDFQYMGGLRGELTLREIKNTNAASTELNRFDLFPTVHTSYKLNENNELMASYSRRINRPSGRDLDPNPNYYNRYTIRIGNPNLEPEYTNSYELGAMRRFGEGRSYVSLDAFHRVTNNKIEGYQTLEDDIFYLRSDNFSRDYSTGLEFTGNINFTEWLLVNASVSMYNYRLTGDLLGESIDRESTNWSGRMNTTLKFAENSRMQFNGFFRGPSVSAQGESKAMFFSNISYRHEFFDKKLSATLSVRDPLGTAKFERESYGEDFNSWFQWKREPRVVMLTLSYRINNFKSDGRGDNGGGGMDMGGGEF